MAIVVLQTFLCTKAKLSYGARAEATPAARTIFSPALWREATHLQSLALQTRGLGQFEARIAFEGHSLSLHFTAGAALDLTFLLLHQDAFSIQIHALDGEILEAAALVGQAPMGVKKAAFVTVSHNRPEAWQKRRALLTTYQNTALYGGMALGIVVDHGGSEIGDETQIKVLRTPNLGGAGGFTRGMLEAREMGAELMIVMDDDASTDIESLHRMHVFLSLARSPKAALAGAMICADAPSTFWEAGAKFGMFCQGFGRGASTLNVPEMQAIEALRPQQGHYGGWWLFGFQIAGADHGPFPLFLRGDDIGFSLANRLEIWALAGVSSTHPPFQNKENARSLYLDLRGHLMHHMVFDGLKIGALRSAWTGALFVLRSLARFRYEEASGVLLAWKDVMAGPERIAQIPDFTRLPLPKIRTPLPEVARENPRAFSRIWGMITVNGHLLPAGRRQDRMSARDLRAMDRVWGCAVITVETAEQTRTDARDLRAFWPLFLALAYRFTAYLICFARLRRSYKKAYATMCSLEAWQSRFLGALGEEAPQDEDQSSLGRGLPRKSFVTTT